MPLYPYRWMNPIRQDRIYTQNCQAGIELNQEELFRDVGVVAARVKRGRSFST
jgi:hypothetical protein